MFMSCCDTSVLTVWLGLGVRNENVLACLGFFSTNEAGKWANYSNNYSKTVGLAVTHSRKMSKQLIRNIKFCCP